MNANKKARLGKGKPRLPAGIAAPAKGAKEGMKAKPTPTGPVVLMAKTRALEWAQKQVPKRQPTDKPKVWAQEWDGDRMIGSFREVMDIRANIVAGVALKAMGVAISQAITDTLSQKGSAADRLNRALALAGVKPRTAPRKSTGRVGKKALSEVVALQAMAEQARRAAASLAPLANLLS